MKNEILEFDKRKVSKEEMIEHYNYYMGLVEQGFKCIEEGDNRSARQFLKLITDSLRKEYKYYNLGKVNNIIFRLDNKIIKDYTNGIYEAYVKVVYANSYKWLNSNFSDVRFYLRYHFKKHLE